MNIVTDTKKEKKLRDEQIHKNQENKHIDYDIVFFEHLSSIFRDYKYKLHKGYIAGPLVPYNHACPKQELIHRDRVMQLMKQALYLQATTAGYNVIVTNREIEKIEEHKICHH